MFATTNLCGLKMKSWSHFIVANVTPTCPGKKSLNASSLGAVPGGEIANAN